MTPAALKEAERALADALLEMDGGGKPIRDALRLIRAELAQDGPSDWDAGAEAMREACANRADDEEEPGDTVPPHVYERLIEVGPFSAAKGAVRATKKAIAKGIRSLPVPARPR